MMSNTIFSLTYDQGPHATRIAYDGVLNAIRPCGIDSKINYPSENTKIISYVLGLEEFSDLEK